MAVTVVSTANSESIVNMATVKLTTDAAAAAAYTYNFGFVPRYISILQATAAGPIVMDEWFDGMPAASSIHTDGTASTGSKAYQTSNGITNNGDGSVTFASAIMTASKTFYILAEA